MYQTKDAASCPRDGMRLEPPSNGFGMAVEPWLEAHGTQGTGILNSARWTSHEYLARRNPAHAVSRLLDAPPKQVLQIAGLRRPPQPHCKLLSIAQ